MKIRGSPVDLLIAEDDDDDYYLTVTAFEKAALNSDIHWVKDGRELLDYLLRLGAYANRVDKRHSQLILLDLNMPRMDGREALKEIKSNSALRSIPVIVMTTSKSDEDILKSYDLGVSSYIRKPVNFSEFIEVAKTFKRYWLELVELPARGGIV